MLSSIRLAACQRAARMYSVYVASYLIRKSAACCIHGTAIAVLLPLHLAHTTHLLRSLSIVLIGFAIADDYHSLRAMRPRPSSAPLQRSHWL